MRRYGLWRFTPSSSSCYLISSRFVYIIHISRFVVGQPPSRPSFGYIRYLPAERYEPWLEDSRTWPVINNRQKESSFRVSTLNLNRFCCRQSVWPNSGSFKFKVTGGDFLIGYLYIKTKNIADISLNFGYYLYHLLVKSLNCALVFVCLSGISRDDAILDATT